MTTYFYVCFNLSGSILITAAILILHSSDTANNSLYAVNKIIKKVKIKNQRVAPQHKKKIKKGKIYKPDTIHTNKYRCISFLINTNAFRYNTHKTPWKVLVLQTAATEVRIWLIMCNNSPVKATSPEKDGTPAFSPYLTTTQSPPPRVLKD